MKLLRVISIAAMTLLATTSCVTATSPKLGAGVGRDGTIAAKSGKASSLKELIAMYDSSSCIECHEEAHEQWEASPHARSIYGTGRAAATMITAMKNGFMSWEYSGVKTTKDIKVEHFMGCMKCHLPQLADAEDKVAVELADTLLDWYENAKLALKDPDNKKAAAKRDAYQETLTSLNINCLVCHNRMAITHKWTDGYPQHDTVYGFNDGEHDDAKFTKMKRSLIMDESILCGQCHGMGPNLELENPTQCATLYGSYMWAYTAEGGHETCQECHMKKSGLGHKILSYSDEKMQEMALDFEVDAYASQWLDGSTLKPKAVVKVKMKNKSGHSIPDG
ncbi:MAG: cytochrome C [Desulfuromonadaceae bacterium]|nr:cytochrome C [Desulfuromonadaceae bacterium]